MERLQPILKQKFWILLGVAIIMTLVGWWKDTSANVEKIKKRQAAIKTAFDSVPKDKIPSEQWTTKLTDINTAQQQSIAATRRAMWNRQLAKRMEWPEGVQPKGAYPGTFSNASKDEYREVAYVEEVTRVWKTLRPFEADGSGIVAFPMENLYSILRKDPGWKGTIQDKEMWDIHEDLLLLETLFQAIASVNGGPDVMRSVEMIHQIDTLELRGGGNKAKPTPVSFATTGMSLAELPMVNPEFNVAEEFGDDGGANSFKSMSSGIATIRMNARGGIIDEEQKNPIVPAATTTNKVVERYIQKDGPYKTRGFYLVVKMDHQKIPQLVAELTANDHSVWPIEIVRMNVSRLHEDLVTSASSGGPLGGRQPVRQNGRIIDEVENQTPVRRFNTTIGGARTGLGSGGALQPGMMLENTEQYRVGKASLDKSLANPVIAQVALLGVFTLYEKVADEPAPAAQPATPTPTPAPPPTDEAQQQPVAAEANPDNPDAKPTGDAESTDPNLTSEPKGEPAAETAAPAADATPEPTPEPAANTNSDNGAPVKKSPDEK